MASFCLQRTANSKAKEYLSTVLESTGGKESFILTDGILK